MKLSLRGYTLIELLVVISIISILAIVGFVNFKDFSSAQVATKAAGQVQTLLRLAQSNATSSTLCSGGGGSWQVRLCDNKIDLICNEPAADFQKNCNESPATFQRSYPVEQVSISVKCSSSDVSSLTLPITISYSHLSGQVKFVGKSATDTCINSTNSLFITVTNSQNTNFKNDFTISKGGAINVQ